MENQPTHSGTDPLKTYHIRVHLLCHYVRLNTWIEMDLPFDHVPSEDEVKPFLWPEVDRVLAKNFCEGCLYEILEIQIS